MVNEHWTSFTLTETYRCKSLVQLGLVAVLKLKIAYKKVLRQYPGILWSTLASHVNTMLHEYGILCRHCTTVTPQYLFVRDSWVLHIQSQWICNSDLSWISSQLPCLISICFPKNLLCFAKLPLVSFITLSVLFLSCVNVYLRSVWFWNACECISKCCRFVFTVQTHNFHILCRSTQPASVTRESVRQVCHIWKDE